MVAVRKFEERFTYSDMLNWGETVQYELYEGVPRAMTAPLMPHQDITSELQFIIKGFLKDKPCKLYHAPSDVRLNYETDDDIVYQPDLYVLCDKSKQFNRGCKGAPDLVIEVLSPSTASIDWIEKYHEYLKAGVKEYWIVDPENRILHQFILENGKYVSNVFGDTDIITSHVLEGLSIKLSEVFEPLETITSDKRPTTSD